MCNLTITISRHKWRSGWPPSLLSQNLFEKVTVSGSPGLLMAAVPIPRRDPFDSRPPRVSTKNSSCGSLFLLICWAFAQYILVCGCFFLLTIFMGVSKVHEMSAPNFGFGFTLVGAAVQLIAFFYSRSLFSFYVFNPYNFTTHGSIKHSLTNSKSRWLFDTRLLTVCPLSFGFKCLAHS